MNLLAFNILDGSQVSFAFSFSSSLLPQTLWYFTFIHFSFCSTGICGGLLCVRLLPGTGTEQWIRDMACSLGAHSLAGELFLTYQFPRKRKDKWVLSEQNQGSKPSPGRKRHLSWAVTLNQVKGVPNRTIPSHDLGTEIIPAWPEHGVRENKVMAERAKTGRGQDYEGLSKPR